MKRGLVDFSRFMGASSMASLGLVLTIGIGGLSSLGAVMAIAGDDAARSAALGMLMLLPMVFALTSRASEGNLSGTAYDIVRRDGAAGPLFAVGWLCVGGYVAISSVMVSAIATRIDNLIRLFVGVDLPDLVIVAPIAVLAGLAEALVPNERPMIRSAFRWILFGAIVFWFSSIALFPPPVDESIQLESRDTRHWLSGLAVFGACLWAVDLLLDYRRQYRRSYKSLGVVIAGSWLVTAATLMCAAILIARHPDLAARAEGQMTIVWERDQFRLLGLVVTFSIAGTTLVKALTRATRLASAMAMDGMLHSSLESSDHAGRLPSGVLVTLAFLVTVLGGLVDYHILIGVAAVCGLFTVAIVLISGVQKAGKRLKPRLKLPARSAFLVVCTLLAVFFAFLVPRPAVLVVGSWLALGFVAHRRFGTTKVVLPEDSTDEGEQIVIPDEHAGRVLVCLGHGDDIKAAIRAGEAVARSAGSDLLVLRVISLMEQIPRSEVTRVAEQRWVELSELLSSTVTGITAYPMVRIAPTIEASLIETANRFNVQQVLLEWDEEAGGTETGHKELVERAISTVRQTVLVARGGLQSGVERVVASLSLGPDTAALLRKGHELSQRLGVPLLATHVHPRLREEAAHEALAKAVEESGLEDLDCRLIVSEDIRQGIVDHLETGDLLLMGCTRDRSTLAFQGVGGLWGEVLQHWDGPGLLVRRAEPTGRRLAARAWNSAFLRLPTLTVRERAEVYAEMRHSAAASVDFHVLIVIASAIATFGLVLDSAGVIIGAMLVAPLMSPIIAISQGIVQGNLRLVRRSLSSTGKGSLTAICVSTAIALILPSTSPTDEIIARTSPSLLDLAVGLAAGAAAAYGVSRKSVAAALPGVAISVALVPPLCVVGLGLAADRPDIGFGALLLFLTNLAAIVFVGVVIFLLLGFSPRSKDRRDHVRSAVLLNILVLVLLSVPLGISSCHSTRENQLEQSVAESFRRRAGQRALDLRNVDVDLAGDAFVVTAGVFVDGDLPEKMAENLRSEVEEATGLPVQLELFLVQARRLTVVKPGDEPAPSLETTGEEKIAVTEAEEGVESPAGTGKGMPPNDAAAGPVPVADPATDTPDESGTVPATGPGKDASPATEPESGSREGKSDPDGG